MQLLKKDIRPNCLQDVLLEQWFAIVLQAVLLQPISMAPKKNGGKMAMKMAAKSKAAPKHKETQKTRIKQEKTSPRRTQKTDVEDCEAPSSSKGTLGYPRGTISALLTSLRYQPKSKKLNAEEKQDAAKALFLVLVCICRSMSRAI